MNGVVDALNKALELEDIELVRKCVQEMGDENWSDVYGHMYDDLYAHSELSILLEALDTIDQKQNLREVTEEIARYAFLAQDVELGRIVKPYALNHFGTMWFACDDDNCSAVNSFDYYLFLRKAGAPEIEKIIEDIDEVKDFNQPDSQQRLFESYVESRAIGGSAHERFLDVLFPHIYNSDYFGEALTEALEHKDVEFLSCAADSMFEEASTLEEIAEVHAIAQAGDNWKVEEQTRAMLSAYDESEVEIQEIGTKLANIAPIRKLATELREKMQEKLRINYPKTILFTPFTGQYASIDYEGFNNNGLGTKTGNEARALAALVD
jgi:hypothetical protein